MERKRDKSQYKEIPPKISNKTKYNWFSKIVAVMKDAAIDIVFKYIILLYFEWCHLMEFAYSFDLKDTRNYIATMIL